MRQKTEKQRRFLATNSFQGKRNKTDTKFKRIFTSGSLITPAVYEQNQETGLIEMVQEAVYEKDPYKDLIECISGEYKDWNYICAGKNSLERQLVIIDVDDVTPEEAIKKLNQLGLVPNYVHYNKLNEHSQIGFVLKESWSIKEYGNKEYLDYENTKKLDVPVKTHKDLSKQLQSYWLSANSPLNKQYKYFETYVWSDKLKQMEVVHNFENGCFTYRHHRAYKAMFQILNLLCYGDTGYTGFNCQNPYCVRDNYETKWLSEYRYTFKEMMSVLEQNVTTEMIIEAVDKKLKYVSDLEKKNKIHLTDKNKEIITNGLQTHSIGKVLDTISEVTSTNQMIMRTMHDYCNEQIYKKHLRRPSYNEVVSFMERERNNILAMSDHFPFSKYNDDNLWQTALVTDYNQWIENNKEFEKATKIQGPEFMRMTTAKMVVTYDRLWKVAQEIKIGNVRDLLTNYSVMSRADKGMVGRVAESFGLSNISRTVKEFSYDRFKTNVVILFRDLKNLHHIYKGFTDGQQKWFDTYFDIFDKENWGVKLLENI